MSSATKYQFQTPSGFLAIDKEIEILQPLTLVEKKILLLKQSANNIIIIHNKTDMQIEHIAGKACTLKTPKQQQHFRKK